MWRLLRYEMKAHCLSKMKRPPRMTRHDTKSASVAFQKSPDRQWLPFNSAFKRSELLEGSMETLRAL